MGKITSENTILNTPDQNTRNKFEEHKLSVNTLHDSLDTEVANRQSAISQETTNRNTALSFKADTATVAAGLMGQGAWNASTNTPTLSSTPLAVGKFYEVSVAGTSSIPTGGSIAYAVRDKIVSNGSVWQHIPIMDAKIVTDNIGTEATIGKTADLSTYIGNNTTATSTRAIFSPFAVNGYLKKIEFWATRAGSVKFKILSNNGDGTFAVKSELTVQAVLGLNTFTGTDFGNIAVSTTDILSWLAAPSTGYIGHKSITDTWYSAATEVTGSSITLTTGTTIAFGINCVAGEFGYIQNSILDLDNEIGLETTIGNQANLSTYTTNNVSESTRAISTPFATDGLIKQVQFWATRAGVLKFKVLQNNGGGTYAIRSEFSVTALAGLNTFSAADLGNIEVQAGDILGWYTIAATGYIGYKSATATFFNGVGDVSGSAITFTTTTVLDFGLNCTITEAETLKGNLQKAQTSITEIQSELASLSSENIGSVASNRKNLLKIGTIKNTVFNAASLPAEWVQVGGFTPTTSGLQSPASGGWGVYAYWDKLIVLDEDKILAKFTVNNAASIFSVAKISSQNFGTVAEVDFSAGKLRLYSVLTALGATPSSVVSEVAIPFSAVAGREYHLTLEKYAELFTITLIDASTLAEVQVIYSNVGQTISCGRGWNSPGVIFRSGDVKLTALNYTSNMPKSPSVLLVGDSIVEADTIRTLPGGGYEKRFAGLLATALFYNIANVARAGETSQNFLSKQTLIASLFTAPKIAIYELGINDVDFTIYQSNFLSFKAAMEAKGAEVVPCTLFPRAGREAYCTQVTNYIIASGLRYIDFAKAMTVAGDRVTRNDTLFTGDLLHPNVLGHQQMFNRIKMDLPELF